MIGIQTAEFPNSIALVDETGYVIEEKIIQSKGRTEEILGTLTKDLLLEQKIAFRDIKAIAVVLGPGSYTGIRIGVAFAKGLAQFSDMPLIGVDSIDVMKRGKEEIVPLIDAKNERVYYKKGARIKVDDIKTVFKDLDISDNHILVGSGVEANKDYLMEMLGKNNLDRDSALHKLTAGNAVVCALGKAGKNRSVFEVKPIYVQEARITKSKKK